MTEDEAFKHLRQTFAAACADHPDLMEPYIIRLDDDAPRAEQMRLMQQGLRETFRRRYPSKALWPAEAAE